MKNMISTVMGARYGYRFLPVDRNNQKSTSERNGIKRMKKSLRNGGKFNSSRIIYLHTLDEKKVCQLLENINTKMESYGIH